jgi:uncharacterized protein (TIGR03435 family)
MNDIDRRGLVKVALVAAAIAVLTAQGVGQERPKFEVATIKPAAPNATPRNQIVPTSPSRLFIPSMSLSWLIYTAYGDGGLNTSMRVTGGPDWVNTTPWAVEAVAPGSPTPRELRLMLQVLLEERFALKLRNQITQNEMNAIVVDRPDGRLGPNVKEWDGTCRNGKPTEEDQPSRPRCLSGYFPGRLLIEGGTMFSAAEALSLPLGRPLVGDITTDRTGLTGRYTLELKYDFTPRRPVDPNAPPEVDGQPSLAAAVKEQWGLRFERGLGPFRLVTVESAQLPAAN